MLTLAVRGFRKDQRFEFHYTPKSASWLNMIEIEFLALARGCLHQRIPTMEELERQVLALVAERHEQRLPINWQFSIPAARSKLSRHYDKIRHDSAETKSSKT